MNGLWAERYFIAGILAAGLSTVSFIPYVAAILRGETKPDRTCWLIWCVLSTLSGGSNLIEGATTSLLFVSSQVFGTLVVCVLSIWFGSGQLLNKSNVTILGVATVGVGSWLLTETAVYGLVISIAVSALAGTRTVWKSYNAPTSENGRPWIMLLVASLFGMYSVGTQDWVLLAYPAYLAVLYATILMARMFGGWAIQERQYEIAWALRRLHVPPVTAVTAGIC